MKPIVPIAAVLCLAAVIGASSAVFGPAAEETHTAVSPEGDALVGVVLPNTLSIRSQSRGAGAPLAVRRHAACLGSDTHGCDLHHDIYS